MSTYFKSGTTVSGQYHGISYRGVVTEARTHTMNRNIVEHTIQLDQPITIYGTPRTRVVVGLTAGVTNQDTMGVV